MQGYQPARATTVPRGDVVVVVRRAARDMTIGFLEPRARSRNGKLLQPRNVARFSSPMRARGSRAARGAWHAGGVTPEEPQLLPDDPSRRRGWDDGLRARLRRGLLDRGRVLATLLADVLAGKKIEARLGPLGIDGKPGMRPEEKLRRALDQVEGRRRLLDAGDDRFGRCDDCG